MEIGDQELLRDALSVVREAMKHEDAQVRRQSAELVTKHRSNASVPPDLVSEAELILELQDDGLDDTTGKPLSGA